MEIASFLLGVILGALVTFYYIFRDQINALLTMGKAAKKVERSGFSVEKIGEMANKLMEAASKSSAVTVSIKPAAQAKASGQTIVQDDGPPPLEPAGGADSDDDPLDHIDEKAVKKASSGLSGSGAGGANATAAGEKNPMENLFASLGNIFQETLKKNPDLLDKLSGMTEILGKASSGDPAAKTAPAPEKPIE